MTIDFFLWCAVINYTLLIIWFILHLTLHGLFTGLGQRFFNMSPDRYDSMTCKGMLFFKLAIWLFNLAPYIALRITS